MDEPTVGLDPEGAKEIMDSIMAKNAEGMTIVFITHDMEFALKNAHRMENSSLIKSLMKSSKIRKLWIKLLWFHLKRLNML